MRSPAARRWAQGLSFAQVGLCTPHNSLILFTHGLRDISVAIGAMDNQLQAGLPRPASLVVEWAFHETPLLKPCHSERNEG
jgi:hypothetical protein